MSTDQFISIPQGRLRVRWLAANAVRVTHGPPGDAPFLPDRPWLEHVFLSHDPTPFDQAELLVEAPDGCARTFTREGTELFREASPPRLGIKQRKPYFSLDIPKTALTWGIERADEGVILTLSIAPDEAFYGWGEWFNAFRRQEGNFRLKIRDAIALLQGHETYSAIPFFLSSRGYGFLLLNSHTSRWRIDPRRGVMEVAADGPGADYVLIYGPSFKRIINTYTALTGRPPLLPRWAFGLWVTSYPQGHQDGVLQHVREHREREIPLDAVILDYHWEERFHNFHWRRSLFPDPDGLIEGLNALGVRLGLIFTPFINHRNRPLQKFLLNRLAHNVPSGHEHDDERALEEYQEAQESGYLAHEDTRWWFGSGGMPDFANPRAAAWWNTLMRPLYEQGVVFFKNDDGEYLPDDACSLLGMDGREYHNLYGFFYGRAIHEGMVALDGEDPTSSRRALIYARSGWVGSQRYPALFLGDQKPTYAGICSTLRAGLNLSLLGFAYWTADVFGLDGKTTPETHMRYAQWALLAPVARYFWRPPEIDDTRFPWSHGPLVEANFLEYAELRYRLLPYYVRLAWEAYQTGLPILRPLMLDYQDDERLAGIYDQTLLGDYLMLCPVIEPGATSRRIVLPEGVWHDFWTHALGASQTWEGPGDIEYTAPLDRLPILVRGGTVLPMGPPLQHISGNHRFERLQFHFWPPYPAESLLYDDDGRTRAYQEGAYSQTRISAQGEETHLVVTIHPAEGTFPEQVDIRSVEIILHRSPPPQHVRVNGKPLDGWRYDIQSGETSIPMVCPTRQETVVEVHANYD